MTNVTVCPVRDIQLGFFDIGVCMCYHAHMAWRRRQVVRQKSAKLLFTGSNPVVASITPLSESSAVLRGVVFHLRIELEGWCVYDWHRHFPPRLCEFNRTP